jgi:transmembrane sensor
MITKKEYIFLYEKYLSGQSTPEDQVLLDSYEDDINLNTNGEHDLEIDKIAVRQKIWLKLQQQITPAAVKEKNDRMWLKIAAILVVACLLGLWMVKSRNTTKSNYLQTKAKKPRITSGGNNAYLTMADGTVITLNDAQNGELATQSGIKISKAKDGMLVYKFVKNNKGNAPNAINTITTPRGGQYQIVLADGTKVWLNAASSLRFPVTFVSNKRDVELTGEAYFEVAKDRNKPFTVQANGTNVQVLGTHFNVSAYLNDAAVSTTLLEGSVKLVKSNETAMLTPGQNGVSVNGRAAIKVEEANVEQVMAWKNGYIVFNNTDIKTIMDQASRWYNIDVVYEGEMSDQVFNGKISKYKDIDELLTNIELTGAVHFKVEGRRVTVMK